MEPEEPKAGQKAILTCESGSSNPTSRIVWRYKNQHKEGVDRSVKPGDYGGNITTNMLEIEIKPDDHGAIVICEAINDDLQESVLNAITLSVKCKCVFVTTYHFKARFREALYLHFLRQMDGGKWGAVVFPRLSLTFPPREKQIRKVFGYPVQVFGLLVCFYTPC